MMCSTLRGDIAFYCSHLRLLRPAYLCTSTTHIIGPTPGPQSLSRSTPEFQFHVFCVLLVSYQKLNCDSKRKSGLFNFILTVFESNMRNKLLLLLAMTMVVARNLLQLTENRPVEVGVLWSFFVKA